MLRLHTPAVAQTTFVKLKNTKNIATLFHN